MMTKLKGGDRMECRKCNYKVALEHRYCPNCGEEINHNAIKNGFINAGRNNVNIGLGNNSTQEIYIESLNVNNQTEEAIVEYNDYLERGVIGGVDAFKRKFQICSILSAIAAVVTIIDYLLTKSNFTIFFVMATLGLFAYAFDSKEKYSALKKEGVVYRKGRVVLSLEQDGKVYKVRKFGFCPICNGRVFIYYDERFKKKLGKCENSDDHLYTYDHTINAGVPYITIDFFHSK